MALTAEFLVFKSTNILALDYYSFRHNKILEYSKSIN